MKIICHMLISIDGKVTGDFLGDKITDATEEYYRINRQFKADAYACGRVTMEGSFTTGWYPDLSEYEAVKDKYDFVIDDLKGFYAVAFDRKGRLGWKEAEIIDEDPGYGGAQIIEVLTEDIDPRYLGYLRKTGISYIFAEDISTAVEKLEKLFGIKTLLLEGGSIINGAFQREELIDELSLVSVPMIAGKEGLPLFYDSRLEGYEPIEAIPIEGNATWLRYKKASL